MQESEAKKLLIALDGLAAYLETIRNLVVSSIRDNELAEEEAPKKKLSTAKKLLDMIPNEPCLHEDTIELQTLGGISMLCNTCGMQV